MEWYDKVAPKFVQNVALGYFQEYVFDPFRVFPLVPVGQNSGYIAKYSKEDWVRIGSPDDYIRMGATESAGDNYEVDKQPYVLYPRSFHDDVTESDVEDYDNPYDPVKDATLFVINRLELVFAQMFVDQFMTTGVWGTDLTGGVDFTKWSDTNSDPVSDVLTWKGDVKGVTGFEPNRMAISNDVYVALRSNSSVRSQLKVTDDKVITSGALKRLMDLEEIIVIDAVKTTAKKGQSATSSNTGFLTTGAALLVFAPTKPSKRIPSAGYHLVKKGKKGLVTKPIPMPHLNNALRIEGTLYGQGIKLAADLGIYAGTVI